MDSTPTDTENSIDEPPKRSRLGRIFKWFVILSSVLVIGVLATLLLLLTYFFPSDMVRQELEVRASEQLQGEVRITSLSFNVLTGLELQEVEFLKQDKSILKFKRLNLNYSLFGLINGKLQINEVLVDQADIQLNLPELAAMGPEEEVPPAPPPPPQPAPSPEEPTLPGLPVEVDLKAFAVNQSNLNLVVSPTLAVDLTNINLDVSGGVTQEEVDLEGSLKIDDIAMALEDQHIRLPLELIFSLAANLPDQQLAIQQLTVQSDPIVRLTLSGTIQEFLTNRLLDLSLHDAELNLDKLLSLAKDFVPNDMRTIEVNGVLSPTLSLKGSLPESEFLGKINFGLEAKGVEADLPSFSTKLEPTDISIQVSDISIKENMPEFGTLKVSVSNKAAYYQDYSIRNFNLTLHNEFFAAGPVKASLEISGVSTIPPAGPIESLTLPLQVQLEADGNFKTQDLLINALDLKLGDLLTVTSRGEVHSQKPDAQGFNVSLSTRLEPKIANLLLLVPSNMLEGISIQKGPGRDVIVLNVTGALNTEYVPSWAKLTTSVKLTDMITSLDALPAGGTLDQANFLVSANYSRQSGEIRGTVGTALQLSDLHQGGSVAVGEMELKLKSSLAGALTPDFELTSLRSNDLVTLQIADVIYDDPSLKAGIDQVRLSLKTKEDVFGQEYIIEELSVTSDPLLELTAQGQYQMADQKFSIKADMPYVNVGGLLSRLSGDLVQGLSGMNPQGRIGFSVKASGRVPQQTEIDSLNIPIDAAATISLQNVEGAFAQHQVKGAGGAISVSFVPGDQTLAKVVTDVQVNSIQLAPGLPVEHLSDATFQLDVTAKDFDEFDLSRLRVGTKGAELDVTGKVTGVQGFLTGNQNLGEMVSKVFAQVNTQASLDLEQFQDVLQSAGIAGSGQAKVKISTLKKEEGPFDARLAVTVKQMNVRQEGRTIQNINGGLSFRKHLVWNPDLSDTSLPTSFNPTDLLSQLRSLTPKRKNLTIDHMDLGVLTISNFATHILFERNAFKIQNLAMNLLGGGFGGNFVLTTGKDFGLSAQIEAANLDLNELLDKELRIKGDSQVDLTTGLTVFFDPQTGALDLSRTELDLYITHIGKEALDRLLVYLDPEGSKPTLVAARAQVRLALPGRVTIQMKRGMMNLEILFTQGLFSKFKMQRVPVGKIKMVQNLTRDVPNWETIAQGLTLIGAETYGIDEEGNILLR
jgi:hypothetical protein